MSHELICEWLGLPAESWPPDHYHLLGLEPGEADVQLIERRVHERMDSVRHYQMMHPDQATEAMNRLAQAYSCLTDSAGKKAYDATLFGTSVAVAVAEAPEPAPQTPDPLAWLFGPAVRPPSAPSDTPPPKSRKTIPPPTVPPEPAEPVDVVVAAAQQSARARRGLGTKRALYARVVTTRKLLHVWDRLGKYIEPTKRRLSRSSDGPEMVRLLREMQALLRRFPHLMGAAGQPGYHVIMLIGQDDPARGFQALDPGQREALSRDWGAGRKLLEAHREFLREELHALRKLTPRERLLRAAYAVVADQPAVFLFFLILLALNIAVWRTYGPQIWQLLQGKF